jgi:DnaJ family protein A protein 2
VLFVHLDGRGIRVESKRGERVIRHGEELCIRGEGMPRLDRDGGGKGDLRVRFEVEMPGASWAARLDTQVGTKRLLFCELRHQGGGVDGKGMSMAEGSDRLSVGPLLICSRGPR